MDASLWPLNRRRHLRNGSAAARSVAGSNRKGTCLDERSFVSLVFGVTDRAFAERVSSTEEDPVYDVDPTSGHADVFDLYADLDISYAVLASAKISRAKSPIRLLRCAS